MKDGSPRPLHQHYAVPFCSVYKSSTHCFLWFGAAFRCRVDQLSVVLVLVALSVSKKFGLLLSQGAFHDNRQLDFDGSLDQWIGFYDVALKGAACSGLKP